MKLVRLVLLMAVLAFVVAISGCQEGQKNQANSCLKKKITYEYCLSSGIHVPQYTYYRSTDCDQE